MATISDSLPPPVASVGALGWLRKNLFSNWYNSLLTLLALWVLYSLLAGLWGMVSTAQWGVVTANLRLFMVGRYPADQVWRPLAAVSLLTFLTGATWGAWGGLARSAAVLGMTLFAVLALLPFETNDRLWAAANVLLILAGMGLVAGIRKFARPREEDATRARMLSGARARRVVTFGWLLSLVLIGALLYGVASLPRVATDLWGGLLLTLTLAAVGIAASFPLGVLLAVGRQSGYPVIRTFCILYIEVIRGLPLVTILFMAQILLPLFLPQEITVERVVRAMVGFTLFTSAYIAETVRGGLQSIGRGQTEAARALGLNGVQTLGLIILPQALRAVIPALVGQFISLFKDTSLVAIVGLLDLAGIAQSAASQSQFLGRQTEVYLFIAAIYWVGASSMSFASRRLERTLGVGER